MHRILTITQKPAICLLLLLPLAAQAQSAHAQKRKGDAAYKAADFAAAEEHYRKAWLKDSSDAQVNYNLGNALYQQQRHEGAGKLYEKALQDPQMSAAERARAFYNLGNALYQQEAYAESVDAYKASLRLNPKDQDAKHNLQMAIGKVQQQPPPEQAPEPGEGDAPPKPEQKAPEDEDSPAPQPAEAPQPPAETPETRRSLSLAEAEELLRIAAEEDKRVREKLRRHEAKTPAQRSKPSKDW